MKKFLVRIRSVQEAKEFVQICEQINGDVNVSNGKKGSGWQIHHGYSESGSVDTITILSHGVYHGFCVC